HVGPRGARVARVGRNDVVSLVAALLDRNHAEGRNRGAHQRELRHELVGWILSVSLVRRIDVAPERILRLVEDDGEMGWLETRGALANELQHLGREQAHCAGWKAVSAI